MGIPSNESELAAALALEVFGGETPPQRIAADAAALCALGRRAQRLAEKRCNGIIRDNCATWTDADESRADTEASTIRDSAEKIAAHYGAHVASVEGDPRGFCRKLRLASGRQNGCEREIWGL